MTARATAVYARSAIGHDGQEAKRGDVIYTRISQDKEALREGVDRQEGLCRDLADRLGLDTVRVFSDPSISALRRKLRPGFQELRSAVERGEVGRILAYHPDRLTRNPTELEELIDLLDAHDVEVVTVTGGTYDLRDATARAMARMVGVWATLESEQKAERVRAKHADLAARGRRAGGPRPYGYTDAKCSAILEEEARWIREAAARAIGGESLTSISRDLNARGSRTTRGAEWNARHLAGKLTSHHLAGIRAYKGQETEGAWEPILDRETWRRLQHQLRDPARKIRKPAVPYLLHGLVFTPAGAPIVGASSQGRRYYGGHGASAPETVLDGLVTEAVLRRLDGRPLRLDDPREALEAVRAELAEIEAEESEYRAMRIAGTLKLAPWRELTEPLAVRRTELEEEAARLDDRADVIQRDLTTPGAARREWPTMSTTQRRAVVRDAVERITLAPAGARGTLSALARNPERVQITWTGEA